MASTTYPYAISTAFPNAKIAPDRLAQEIRTSSITTALDYIETVGDTCNIIFKNALSTGEQSTLASLVAAHQGASFADPPTVVNLDVPQTSEGRPIFQPSSFPGGVFIYVAGAGDDATQGRGKGQMFSAESDVAGDTTIEFSFLDWVYMSGGGVVFQGGQFGDWVDLVFNAPATPVTANGAGTGNANLVPPYTGAPAILIVPAAGNGAYDVDLSQASLVPAVDANDAGTGYWDWSEPDTGKGVVSAGVSPGHSRWHLFSISVDLVRFVNHFPLLGGGGFDLNLPPIKSKKMLPSWKGKVTLHNTGHAGLKAAWFFYMARAKTL